MNAIVKVVTEGRQRRRRHSKEFEAEVVRACRRRGVSIAAVALANGLNANLVRRWVDAAERGDEDGVVSTRAPVSKEDCTSSSRQGGGHEGLALPNAIATTSPPLTGC